MAPAPIPADPTLLSSPLNNSSKQPASTCVSRRFASAVSLSSIQETLSQEDTETATRTVSEPTASPAEHQETFDNRENSRNNEPLHDIQTSRNTCESFSINVTKVNKLENNLQKNICATIIEPSNPKIESLLVREVQRSYNRLSLNNKVRTTTISLCQH